MSYRKRKYHRERPMTRTEKIGWLIASAVFVLCFMAYFIYGFFTNCIFRWPIRWNVDECWHEQIAPAQNKAAESASNFIPN